MRTAEITNERALDTLADIIEPASVILTDPEVKKLFGESKMDGVKYILRKHQKEVIEILAYLDGEDPKTYKFNLFALPKKILEILNDPEVSDFFTSQVTVTE